MGEQSTAVWFERNPSRLVLEQNAVASRFPGFQLFREEHTLFWVGTLRTNGGNRYEVTVEYPDNFPDAPPKVFPTNPKIELWRDDESFKHQYRDGSLCLFHPSDRFFEPNTTAVTVIATAAAWLFSFEQWLASGRKKWPGVEAD
jgi:hypothetical protein